MSAGPSPRATSLSLERLLPAPVEAVYAAWTDAARIGEWMSPTGHAVAEVDLRLGGAFRIVMVGDGRRIEHSGEYLELDPPRRLRFTWRSPYAGAEPSVVTVVLEPEGDGTRLLLTHEGLPAEAVASHAGGWGAMVHRLGETLRANVTKEAGT